MSDHAGWWLVDFKPSESAGVAFTGTGTTLEQALDDLQRRLDEGVQRTQATAEQVATAAAKLRKAVHDVRL